MEDFIQPKDENPVDPIDLSIFKEHIQKTLLNIITSLPKIEKRLVLESSIIPKLSFFFNDISILVNEQVKKEIINLNKNMKIDTEIMIFLIPGKIQFLKEILEIIRKYFKEIQLNQGINQKLSEFHIIFIPKINNDCKQYLKSDFNEPYIKTYNLNMDIYSLDYDLMSLEENDSIKDLYIDKNYNCLSILSRSILKFETVFGRIKHKYYKGNFSKKIIELLKRDEERTPFENDNEILASILIDRDVDFITLFCTQATYEGMIDDYFNINLNSIKVSPSLLDKESKKDLLKVDLSSNNKFYTMIKNYSFNKIRIFLPNRLLIHSKILEEGKKVTDLKKLQKGLERVKLMKEERQALTDNINLADYLSQQQKSPLYRLCLLFEQGLLIGELPNQLHDFYESQIGKKNDKELILRLLSLESLVQSGIKSKFYDDFKRDFFNIYGQQEIFLWNNLEKMNILKKEDKKYLYYNTNKSLNLINDNVNVLKPNDPSYSYGGYCPIIVKLIEKAIKVGWNDIKNILNELPGDYFYPNDEKDILFPKSKSFILLVFVGGITYGEIAALRYLNSKNNKIKFIIMTTHIITNKRFFQSISTFNINEGDQYTYKEFYENYEMWKKKK